MQRLTVVLGIVLFSTFGRSFPTAQADGHAEISRPGAGDTVSGVVTILGSASSTSFDHYELSFGYDPDPTATWFPIGEAVSTQVSFGRLGLWDTSRITDGTYALRLTVALEDGSVLEDVVRGIEVWGSAGGAAGPASGTVGPSTEPTVERPIAGLATATVGPAATAVTAGIQPRARGRGINVGTVILFGAGAGVFGLVGLAAYVQIRRSLRRRWGTVLARRLRPDPNTEGRRGGRPS